MGAKASTFSKKEAWRNYMAEGIKMLSEAIATAYGGGYLAISYDDVINPKPKKERLTPEKEARERLAQFGIKVV